MKPVLFEESARAFETNGIGTLADAISCVVTEELNGAFELKMDYPVNGIFAKEIDVRRIILAAPNPFKRAQPFRIYRVDKKLSKISVSAAHVSYDLNNYVSTWENYTDFYKEGDAIFEQGINGEIGFRMNVLEQTDLVFVENPPRTVRNLIMEFASKVGDLEFDHFDINLIPSGRGSLSNFKIQYGKNLTDYSSSFTLEQTYTHLFPYAKKTYSIGEDGESVTDWLVLPEFLINTGFSANFKKILPLDLSQEFTYIGESFDMLTDTTKQEIYQQMRELATEEAKKYAAPKVSYSIKFASLVGSNEKTFEKITIGDTVFVEVPQFDVDVPVRCVKIQFNCLKNRYDSVDFGEPRKGIQRFILATNKTTQQNSAAITEERYYVNGKLNT